MRKQTLKKKVLRDWMKLRGIRRRLRDSERGLYVSQLERITGLAEQ